MKLQINDPKDQIDSNFIEWLIEEIKLDIIAELNLKKLTIWDSYLNSNSEYKIISNKKITAKEIIFAGINNLKYISTSGLYQIFIDSNKLTPGLDKVRLDTLCKLINFGNLQMKGYPIFTDTFDKVANNISDYIETYIGLE